MPQTVSARQVVRSWGGALFLWHVNAPYLVSGGMLVTIALVMTWRLMQRRPEVGW
jgi:hypothetical protein